MKIGKFKQWFSLEEAAARLSTLFEENVTEADMVQLAAQGDIQPSWFLRGQHFGRRVEVYCPYPRTDYIASRPEYDENGEYSGRSLAGIFDLPMGLCDAWGWWLLTFIGKGGESQDLCGALVTEENGTIWELYEPSGSDFMDFPAKEDIVFRTTALAAFERRAIDEPKDVAPSEINGKSETSYLSIIGALSDLYWRERYPDESKINQAKLIDELRGYHGYPGMSERNLKDKLSKAIKAIRSE